MQVLLDNSGTKIDGKPLSDMGLMLSGAISTGAPEAAMSLTDVPGMDGSLDLSLKGVTGRPFFNRRQVIVPLAAVGTRDDVISAKASLGMYNGMQVDLFDPRLKGCWRGILTVGEWTDMHESWDGMFASTASVTIEAEPTLVLGERTVSVSSSQTNVFVYGTQPVWPKFTLTPTGSSNTIGVTVSKMNGNVIGSVSHTSSVNITSTVTVDCFMGVMVSGGARLAVSIDDDFPQLIPGDILVTPIGCSSASLSYEPRVMI